MTDAKDLIGDLIVKLYKEASSKYRIKFSRFDQNCFIKAHNNQFLGNFGNRFDENSIFNRFGTHGSRFSEFSIFNRFGTYGGRFSDLSPYNRFTSTPPGLYDMNNNFVGYLTANRFTGNSIDTNSIIVKALHDMGMPERTEELIREY